VITFHPKLFWIRWTLGGLTGTQLSRYAGKYAATAVLVCARPRPWTWLSPMRSHASSMLLLAFCICLLLAAGMGVWMCCIQMSPAPVAAQNSLWVCGRQRGWVRTPVAVLEPFPPCRHVPVCYAYTMPSSPYGPAWDLVNYVVQLCGSPIRRVDMSCGLLLKSVCVVASCAMLSLGPLVHVNSGLCVRLSVFCVFVLATMEVCLTSYAASLITFVIYQ
jgi:hypothetical protein